MSTRSIFDPLISAMDCSPFGVASGRKKHRRRPAQPLYTQEERARRDATSWTIVQGILAPVQFLIFFISLLFVIRYLVTGDGLQIATASVILKTAILYFIMTTGCIWEKVVFGKYLFARSFFWEDMFSMLVLILHTGYLAMIIFEVGSSILQMYLALAAYVAYVINAAQFLMKLRAAKRSERVVYPVGHAA